MVDVAMGVDDMGRRNVFFTEESLEPSPLIDLIHSRINDQAGSVRIIQDIGVFTESVKGKSLDTHSKEVQRKYNFRTAGRIYRV